MKTLYKFNADPYYPWLLVCALASVIGAIAWQMNLSAELGNVGPLQRLYSENALVMPLTLAALFTLACRIVFACCYRPHLPVDDRDLPFITVIIPAFNEGAQVFYTVHSVMANRYPHNKMEVICVDDGSQDDTWLWMTRAKNEFGGRVQLVRQPANQGKRHALLTAFGKARGTIHITIDSDSEVLPETLRHLVSPFVRDQQVGAVAGNVRVLNLMEGAIPKMMDISFTLAFDFIRRAQSVYGGVFCTPGALSAYRAAVIKPHLVSWANQTFMGVRANIGEDRAITNLILGCGYRVVYQQDAVVLTKIPASYGALWRMLVRWARSGVRENLAMISVLVKRFRVGHNGGGWIRLFSATQLISMTFSGALKFAVIVQMGLLPIMTVISLVLGALTAAILAAVVHQIRYGGWFGWRWAIPYSFFWVFGLSWISFWGLVTASRSGWLTRGVSDNTGAPCPTALVPPPGRA